MVLVPLKVIDLYKPVERGRSGDNGTDGGKTQE
jgi:hypothetical protein